MAEEERAEKEGGHDEGEEGPGADVELVVGRRLGAHGEKVKGKGEKVKGGRRGWGRKKSARNGPAMAGREEQGTFPSATWERGKG